MRLKLKKGDREEKSVNDSADDEDDDWSFATDDVVSIGSLIAEGLSKEELMFFKRLEYELREVQHIVYLPNLQSTSSFNSNNTLSRKSLTILPAARRSYLISLAACVHSM